MNFLKTLLASTLGFFLALIIIFILAIGSVVIIVSTSGDQHPYVAPNTVLRMNISGSLPARSYVNPFNKFLDQSNGGGGVSLAELKGNLRKAATDDDIRGVLLHVGVVSEEWANLQEAYRAIAQFRDSTKKFVYATTDDGGLNEKGYYLTTAADSVFTPPQSFFEFDGFYTEVMFYKGLFDKLGINAEIARHGKYKGAVEPYFRKSLSEANKYQLQQLLNNVSSEFLRAVRKKTGRSVAELNNTLNTAPHLTASFGYKNGFIDSLMYTNQLDSLIDRRMKLHDDETFNTITSDKYAMANVTTDTTDQSGAGGDIAIIYAAGTIKSASAQNNPLQQATNITAPWFKKQLDNAIDDGADAVVIRLNSPGGSGSASDAIWNMIEQRRKKVPIIVSMGNVAASGGYYIAMAADTIVAEPTTITGSIGVFATNFDAQKMFNTKLGITFDDVKSNTHADWLSQTHDFSSSEKKAFEANITQFYQTFVQKVARARNLSKETVQSIAQGRVWSGKDALQQKLVDVLGGLDKAKKIAGKKAGLNHWTIHTYPGQKGVLQLLMNATETKAQTMFNFSFFSDTGVDKIRSQLGILKERGPLLLFPYDIKMQ